jgi:hypothetical protein
MAEFPSLRSSFRLGSFVDQFTINDELPVAHGLLAAVSVATKVPAHNAQVL